jgi:hypothetical protein
MRGSTVPRPAGAAMTAWQSGTGGAEPELVIRGPTAMLPKGADGRYTIETVRLAAHLQELPCLFDEPGSAVVGLLPSPGRSAATRRHLAGVAMIAGQSGTRGAEPEIVICGPTVMLPEVADGRHTIETVSLAVHTPEIPCLIDGSAAMGLPPSPGRTSSIPGVTGGRLRDD